MRTHDVAACETAEEMFSLPPSTVFGLLRDEAFDKAPAWVSPLLASDPDLWVKWLGTLINDLNSQISFRKGEMSIGNIPRDEYLAWHGRISHIRKMVEMRRRSVMSALARNGQVHDDGRASSKEEWRISVAESLACECGWTPPDATVTDMLVAAVVHLREHLGTV